MATAAPACRQALQDATARWPKRKKGSDGIMGDEEHQARTSDHNDGNAVDVTHDPDSGCVGRLIAAHAVKDSRSTLVIHNRLANDCDGSGWRHYKGENPHTGHCHISIDDEQRNDTKSWGWLDPKNDATVELQPLPEDVPPTSPWPPLWTGRPVTRGQQGTLVLAVQWQLKRLRYRVDVDGTFGSGTEGVVKEFQAQKGLKDNGVVNEATWKALFGP